MALRLDSGSYGLRQGSSANKTVLLMKLTDSALRIIESYQDKGNLRSKPNIQFQGHQGIIQIPVPGGGENDVQKFSFQVSNLSQSAGVDCLQQIRSGHTARVECLGSVHQKITVNAKDDSYDMTRQRMTLAKQEEQKTSTKVIKQPGSKMGKLVKKTTKGRVIEKSHLPPRGKLSPDTRAPTPPLSRLTPTLLNRSSSPLTIPSKDRSASPPVPGSGRNKTKPTISISSSSLNQKGGTSPNNTNGSNAVAARPLRDRVAHLLAIRSYKYPEIMVRLQKDKPPDKTRLQEILAQVSSTRSTNGVTEFSLLRNIYQNLQPDTWPGYTETERKTVKKKIMEMYTSSESRKRPYTNTFSPPEANSDGGHEEEYSNPTSKKQRVSHIKGRTSGGSSPMDVDKLKPRSPGTTAISFGTAQLPSSKTQPPPRKPSRSPEKPKTVAKQTTSSPPKILEKKPSPAMYKAEQHSHSANGFESPPEEEDFMTKYTSIISDEQRDQYKRDFYAEYQEYLKRHSNVARVSDKFAELQRKLNEHKKGSKEYKEISKEVIQEYKKTKKNDEYHRERARWEFLHRKLRHIKELVSQFDQHKLVGNLPENDNGFSMQTKTATRVA